MGFLIKTIMLLRKMDRLEYFQEHIYYGDTNPAIVVSIDPLIIAAYTDEKAKKEEICEERWSYVYNLALEYVERFPNKYRDGNPLLSRLPR